MAADRVVKELLTIRDDASNSTFKTMEELKAKTREFITDPTAFMRPVPANLADALDTFVLQSLGCIGHCSHRTLFATTRGKAEPMMAGCYISATDDPAIVKTKLGEMTSKLKARLSTRSLFNVAHMAEEHRMMRLPNSCIQLLCAITAYTPGESDESIESSSD